jgi:hypothetical protein
LVDALGGGEVREDGYDACEGSQVSGSGEEMAEQSDDAEKGVHLTVGVTDFDDVSSSGVVYAVEVSRLVDSAEEAWDLRAPNN